MNIDNVKEKLIAQNVLYITTIDRLPLTTLNKLSIIQQYVYSKYRWLFSIYNLSETWVVQNIDNVIGKYVRKWFQLPICANIDHLSFPTNKLGVNFMFAKTVYMKCKLSVRRIIKLSNNAEIRRLYDISSEKNIRADSLINSVTECNPQLNKKQINAKIDRSFGSTQNKTSWNNFMELKEQNIIIKQIVMACPPKVINMWQSLVKHLPNNIICFIRKALIFCLPNKSNLYRWKISEDNKCSMINKAEPQLQILSNRAW